MNVSVGIGLAFVAMLSWGLGDFLIQRATRKIGDTETLFVITLFGTIVLLPFVYKNIPQIFGNLDSTFYILLACAILIFIAALVDFEALRVGKLAIVEPIWSLEIPVAGFLAFFIMNEKITSLQVVLIIILIVGLVMVSFRERHWHQFKRFFLEKGVLLAFLAALMMGGANFFLGWGSRVSDPLMANFFLNIFITVIMGVYLVLKGRLGRLIKDCRNNQGLLLTMSISDNVAWIAFAFAMSLAPIAIATALSESYIIVAVLLGLLLNREKLQRHQKIGLALALVMAIILAAVTV